MKRLILILLLAAPIATGAKHISDKTKMRIDSLMKAGLANGYYPGASIAVGNHDGIQYSQVYGYCEPEKKTEVTPGHLYDIASLTKVVATTFAAMRLYDGGLLDINKPVGEYIHDYDGTPIEKVLVSQLMTHTSGIGNILLYKILYSNPTGDPIISFKEKEGYPYYVDNKCYMCQEVVADTVFLSSCERDGYRQIGDTLFISPAVDTMVVRNIVELYKPEKKGTVVYSDLNFYILRSIIESVTATSFDRYAHSLFDELGMDHTGFNPRQWATDDIIVPTENDMLMRRGPLHGIVHDELSAVSGGVQGNAGVFSTAEDIARFCEMMLNDGIYKGRRIINRETVKLFTSSPLSPRKIYRGLGFDRRNPGSAHPLSVGYGHTGYTGTIFWIDPEADIYMVFLSNRVNPSRTNVGLSTSQLRTRLWEIINE